MVRLAHVFTAGSLAAEELVQDAFERMQHRWNRIEQPEACLRVAVVKACAEVAGALVGLAYGLRLGPSGAGEDEPRVRAARAPGTRIEARSRSPIVGYTCRNFGDNHTFHARAAVHLLLGRRWPPDQGACASSGSRCANLRSCDHQSGGQTERSVPRGTLRAYAGTRLC